MGQRRCAARQQLEDWVSKVATGRVGGPMFACGQIGRSNYEVRQSATECSSMGKESFQTSGCKNMWGLRWPEKLQASQESSLERPTGS